MVICPHTTSRTLVQIFLPEDMELFLMESDLNN
jgi:hypothetical protein